MRSGCPSPVKSPGGRGRTVKIAALLVVVPAALANTARKRFPLSTRAVENWYVVCVAPLTFVQFPPLSVLTCHCTVGAGSPVPAALKLAICPTYTVALLG